jgi:hypothetical protein
MFQEQKVFNGGINNLTAPHLIQPNQGVYISNTDISNGEIVSARQTVDTLTDVLGDSAWYYKTADEVVSSVEDRFYVEWAGMLYWSNSAGSIKRYDGTSVLDIGSHTAPATAPTGATSGAGLLEGDYTYTMTYVHDDVFESEPCAFVPLTAVKNQLKLTFTDTPPATATYRNIYRSGGLNPTFNLVSKVSVTATDYTDNISDFNISRKELTTYNNDTVTPNLDMLVMNKGTLFASAGNKVYFSKEGQPEYWNDYNYVVLPKDVAGLGVHGSAIVAFTDDSMFIITGTNINNISIEKLPYSFGCKDKRTVANVDGTLVWVASLDEGDVICAYVGGTVQILNKLDPLINSATVSSLSYDDFETGTYDAYSFTINHAIVSNRKYYLFMNNRTAVVDFTEGVKTYYMSETINSAYSKANSLYVIAGTDVYEYMPSFSNYRNLVYKTGDLDNGNATRVKNYRYIKINATGAYKVTVIVDGQTIMSSEQEKDFLPANVYGKLISFVVESTGYAKIKSISYEYELLKD